MQHLKMESVRIAFTKALGLGWSKKLHPSSGYKYEHNLTSRQQYLAEALRLRDKFAAMVQKTGRRHDILERK